MAISQGLLYRLPSRIGGKCKLKFAGLVHIWNRFSGCTASIDNLACGIYDAQPYTLWSLKVRSLTTLPHRLWYRNIQVLRDSQAELRGICLPFKSAIYTQAILTRMSTCRKYPAFWKHVLAKIVLSTCLTFLSCQIGRSGNLGSTYYMLRITTRFPLPLSPKLYIFHHHIRSAYLFCMLLVPNFDSGRSQLLLFHFVSKIRRHAQSK
jgi:hypothetical protein